MNITVLCGGVGAAKLLQGFKYLQNVCEDISISAIVNTADDDYFYGYKVCPDIDSILYHLSELHDPIRGWGRKDETFNFVQSLKELDVEAWFNLGDKDLALNHLRTEKLKSGITLTETTQLLRKLLGISSIEILPMSDQDISTQIITSENKTLSMQEYFVREQCKPRISKIHYLNAPSNTTHQIKNALEKSDRIIIAPSNPFLSILPILEIKEIAMFLEHSKEKVWAVSPIVKGKAIKGPLENIFKNFDLEPHPKNVLKIYEKYISTFVVDSQDKNELQNFDGTKTKIIHTDTIMSDTSKKKQLAEFLIKDIR